MNQIQAQLLLQSVVSWHCGGSWRRLCLFQSEDSHAAARPRFMLQTKAESLCVLPNYDMKDRTFSFTYRTDFLTHLQLYDMNNSLYGQIQPLQLETLTLNELLLAEKLNFFCLV